MGAASAVAETRRILLVDDIELNRVLTEAVLRSATYEVDSVSDGASAIAALECGTYDLVLMDLEMPGLNGHETAAAIRRREAETADKPAVRLAAISAQTGASVSLRSAEVGMAAHIARPIALHELLRQIERVFCQPQAIAEPDPWDRECYDEWASRLGAERMNGFLVSLQSQFRDLLKLLTVRTDKTIVHRVAHDVASTGGMLGFSEVTRCCRALLEASDATCDSVAHLELKRALGRAVARLDGHFLTAHPAAVAA